MGDYSEAEVCTIIDAYRALFPNPDGALMEYWDYARRREWSLLTTDFHHAELPSIRALDAAARRLNGEVKRQGRSLWLGSAPVQEPWTRRYRDLVMEHGVGYSLGISPITDDLLLRTFSSQTRRVVILLGHDWYPVIAMGPNGIEPFLPIPPIQKYTILSEAKYAHAVHPLLGAPECAVLFLNLYPDFRGPGVNKLGSLGDYTAWGNGLAAICRSICSRFELAGLISWGAHVWQPLQKLLPAPFRSIGIMAAVTEQQRLRAPLRLPLGAGTVPHFPFAHPSFGTNFAKQRQWYQEACAQIVHRQQGTSVRSAQPPG